MSAATKSTPRPDANRLTIHIIAAVAEAVGRTISENTKTALAAAKARGVKLGNPNGARALRGKQVGNADAVAKIKENATQRAADLQGIVDEIRRSGCWPRFLNDGHRTFNKKLRSHRRA